MISMVSSSAATALAADGTLYFNSGENIPYGTYSTTRMTFDGANTAYCLEPSKKTPVAGSYQYNYLPAGSPIRKALYYLNGGYGYEKITKNQCFGGWSDTDSYVIGHLVLSYIFDNYNYAVNGCQSSVSILSKILVTRSVKNVYLIIAVIESHYGSRY